MLARDVHTDELVCCRFFRLKTPFNSNVNRNEFSFLCLVQVAIKCFDRSRISNVQRIRHEIEASRAAQHPHIIRFIKVGVCFYTVHSNLVFSWIIFSRSHFQEFDTAKEICIAMVRIHLPWED
jgi:hypothetical protein